MCSIKLKREDRASPDKMRHFLQNIDILINGTYWDPTLPRFCPTSLLQELSDAKQLKLKIIGDITCDIEGAIECTLKSTTIDNPVFIYDLAACNIVDTVQNGSIIVMSVDHLPTEFPQECTEDVGDVMYRYFLELFQTTNISQPFDEKNLPAAWINAAIIDKGQLTKKYAYLEQFLS